MSIPFGHLVLQTKHEEQIQKVLAFNTGQIGGIASLVIIRHDGKEMLVRDNSKRSSPDTFEGILLPQSFKDPNHPYDDVSYW